MDTATEINKGAEKRVLMDKNAPRKKEPRIFAGKSTNTIETEDVTPAPEPSNKELKKTRLKTPKTAAIEIERMVDAVSRKEMAFIVRT